MQSRAVISVLLTGALFMGLGAVLSGPGARRASGAEATGGVAGWVYYGYCQPYAYGPAGATAPPTGGSAPPGGAPAPDGPVIAYPIPSPLPAVGVLVALQGTDLATTTDEEGFFFIEGVPLGVYYTVAASFPRRPRPLNQAETGRPAAPVPGPVVCAATSSWRGNVVVLDPNRPSNVGALILPRLGPRPLTPDQATPQETPGEDEEP